MRRQARGSGSDGRGQLAVPGSGPVDRAHGIAVARPARGVRQLELSLPALSPMGLEGDLRAGFRELVRRPRFRIRDHRRHHRPGPPARNRRKRGTQNQAIGRSRGGLTTKIVALVDALGNLVRFVLLPGQRHDIVAVAPLIEGVSFDALLGDKGFDADWLRADLDDRGAAAVIPPRSNRKVSIDYDKEMYRWRHLVENYFAKIKEFRSIATRYDKTAESFSANINLAAALIAAR